jgi:hypothetical protein
MKLSIAAVAAVFVLCSPALAQQLNGGETLGQSQLGTTAGVPYPNRAATDDPTPEATERTAPVESGDAKVQGAAAPKPHKKASKKPASAGKTATAKDKVTPTNSPAPGASSPH